MRETVEFVPQSEQRCGQLNKLIGWQNHWKTFDNIGDATIALDEIIAKADRFYTGNYRVIKRTVTTVESAVLEKSTAA